MNTITHNIFVTIKPSKKLAKVNRRTMVLAVAGIGFAVWAEINRREQEEQIELLARKITNLEHGEGE